MEQQDIPILFPGSSVFIEHKEASSSPSCIYIHWHLKERNTRISRILLYDIDFCVNISLIEKYNKIRIFLSRTAFRSLALITSLFKAHKISAHDFI